MKRDTPQENDLYKFGAIARWERMKKHENVPLDMFLPLQDTIVVRTLCHFVDIIGSLKTEMDIHSIHLVSLFLEDFFTYASHYQQCSLYHSIMSHGIEDYASFEVMFSRSSVAVKLAEVLHNFIVEFNHFMPLPDRFYYRDSASRESAGNVHDRVIISSTDGVSNASPQRHFEGILRHLTYFFRLPYISDELELIRKSIINATCPFLIGALCMMEAPYLFDEIVHNCLSVVESIKIRDHDTLLSSFVAGNCDSQFKIYSAKFMGDDSCNMRPSYPHVLETLKDMSMNVKGEDTSALKKFAYTLFGTEKDYHTFTPGLHLKFENQGGTKDSSSVSATDHAPGVIEDYGKMVVEDISWSATKHFKKELCD